jgi:GNAT superfamily N-acetyltransferase
MILPRIKIGTLMVPSDSPNKDAMKIRLIRNEEYLEASAVALEAFGHAVAPLYPPEGIETFRTYAQPSAIQQRDGEGHVTFVAETAAGLVGILHVRNDTHVAMLFVLLAYQRRGVARTLLAAADTRTCLVSVNASPNSVTAYEAFGFVATGPKEQQKGMWVVPMRRRPSNV